MPAELLLQVGRARLSASRVGDREELTRLLSAPGSVRELSHGGQAVLLTALLAELHPEQQAAVLATPRAIWSLATCGAATEVSALVAAFSASQQTLVLSSAMAVDGLVREHRSGAWGWLERLPPTAQAHILRAEGSIFALVIDRDSAGKVATLIEALEPSAQVGIFSRTDAIACLARHGQSTRVLELLAKRSGAELASFLPGRGALQRMAQEGHVGKLAELVSSMAAEDRASMLTSYDGVSAFTRHGRRAQVKEWLLALSEETQRRVFLSNRGLFRVLTSGPDAIDAEELAAALGPGLSRLLQTSLRGFQLGEEMKQRALSAIEWLEAQPLASCFSICDRDTWSALRHGGFEAAPERHVAVLAKLTLDQRVRLLSGRSVVGLLAHLGAAAPLTQLIAELPERERFEILRQPSDIASLASHGAAPRVAQMIEALPASAQIQLFREVRGYWKELPWPPQTVATKLALLLGELDQAERFELVVENDHAALLLTHGYGAFVSELLDTCAPEQCVQLLQTVDLVPALCRAEGLAKVAARLESLPPEERILLLTHPVSISSWVAEGLAPTLFHLLEQTTPADLDRALESEPDPEADPDSDLMFVEARAGLWLKEWRSTLARPADQRLKLVRATDA